MAKVKAEPKAKAQEKNKGGRPEHVPSAERRFMVKGMRANGHNLEEIAGQMQIAPRTLNKHYGFEIEQGAVDLNARVVAAVYAKALKGDFQAMKFILKSKCGWNDNEVASTNINIEPQRVEAPIIEGEFVDLDAVINQ